MKLVGQPNFKQKIKFNDTQNKAGAKGVLENIGCSHSRPTNGIADNSSNLNIFKRKIEKSCKIKNLLLDSTVT